MKKMLERILGKGKPTRYCTCGSDAVYPKSDPLWCEVCWPTYLRRKR